MTRPGPVTQGIARVAAVLLLGMAVTGCVTPARNAPQYREKAVAAVQAASAGVATGVLVVRQDRAEKILQTYADEVVTAAETSIGPISASFGSVQPPDKRSDHIRDTVTGVLSKAEDALAHARIAVRRSDPAALASAEGELHSVADELDQLEEELG
jgi:hypothetical protein